MSHGGRRARSGRTVGSGISEDARQAILSEYAAGLPTAEIAARYGVSSSYPTILAGRYGVRRRLNSETRAAMAAAHERRPTDADDVVVRTRNAALDLSEVRRLAAKGVKVTAIAALLRCPYRDVLAAVGA